MSDPSAIQLPVSQALTSDMLLGLKPSAPKSRSYRISVPPLNKNVFAPGDQMIFELPTGRKGTWLDQSQSYIKFSVQVAATGATAVGGTGVYLDNTAYSFIQRLDIYNSSNLLETINEYGQLANFLLDTGLTQSDKVGLSPMIGSNSYNYLTSPAGAYAQFANVATVQVPGDRSGQSLAAVTVAGGNINTAIPYTYCLPVLSGIVGSNASKMLPVGLIQNPIRCEFYLSAVNDAIYAGTTAAGATWQLINVEFVVCYVELTDGSLDMQMEPDEAQYIATTTYRQTSATIPLATAGEFTNMLPFRCSSLTAIYARFRNQTSAVNGVNASAAYRKSSSVNPNLASYYFRIGSSMYPNKPVYLMSSQSGTGAEGYAELLKSFHALSASVGNSAIPYSNYNVATTATLGFAQAYVPAGRNAAVVPDTFGNAFAIGLELQSFSNRSDTILSGISTLNSQVFFTGTVYNGLTAGGVDNHDITADFFAQMDMILVLQNGILTAKY
jgi:hypothetical protein